jgi:UTP--glucose-1-phosphate uridylyltransferase
MHATPRKAVIPVAGLGTRFLPATKAMPKEMLPLVDKPVIQYVVEEAVASGLTDILFVTGRDKYALENHFDTSADLESRLEAKGDQEKLDLVQAPTELGNIHYVRQGGAKGLGHAVNAAASFTSDEPFAVLLGDDVVEENSDLLKTMIAVHGKTGANVVALVEVPREEIHKYGCIKPAGPEVDGVIEVSDFVEKPKLRSHRPLHFEPWHSRIARKARTWRWWRDSTHGCSGQGRTRETRRWRGWRCVPW